jgi:hypothetical protein
MWRAAEQPPISSPTVAAQTPRIPAGSRDFQTCRGHMPRQAVPMSRAVLTWAGMADQCASKDSTPPTAMWRPVQSSFMQPGMSARREPIPLAIFVAMLPNLAKREKRPLGTRRPLGENRSGGTGGQSSKRPRYTDRQTSLHGSLDLLQAGTFHLPSKHRPVSRAKPSGSTPVSA